jgi:uncharacterized membrane protein
MTPAGNRTAVVLAAWNSARARLCAGILALFWFSHGVMSAWSHADTRLLALTETSLALLLVMAVSWNGLHARFVRRRTSP